MRLNGCEMVDLVSRMSCNDELYKRIDDNTAIVLGKSEMNGDFEMF